MSHPPQPAPLPDDLFIQVKRLLLPHIATVDAREALLIDAFYIRERRLYLAVTRDGAPNTFASLCCKTLFDFGCLAGGTHALSALLGALRPLCGDAQLREIEVLSCALDGVCAEGATPPGGEPPLPPIPVTHPTQTTDTPADERSATVFVSYSHHDAAAAQQVMADLQAAGHACWIDTSSLKGGDEWIRAISQGINNSYAVVVLCSRQALGSRWVWKEIAWAEQKGKRVIPVLLEDVLNDDAFFGLHIYQAVLLHRGYADGLRLLLASLPQPPPRPAPGGPEKGIAKGIDLRPAARTEAELRAERRKLELEYLDSLRLRELLNAEKYTPLAGTSQAADRLAMGRQSPAHRLEPVVMRPEFELLPRLPERGEMEAARLADVERAAPRRFENAVDELLRLRRAMVLGEPGAGKTTTLWALASRLVDQALADPRAPVPLLIRLGNWTQPGQPLGDFVAGELGELGGSLESLLAEGRAALLLDGLNETPAAQREAKSRELQAFVDRQAGLMAIVTCREQDYAPDLGFDRVNILPLDPARIQEFVTRYLGQADGERLFWKLAGDERLKQLWEKWQGASASFELFWNAPDIPRENPNVYGSTNGADDDLWRKHVRQPGGLMALARNPYMLLMLTQVFVDQQGELPANRGRLFASFVDLLLAREHAASRDPRTRRTALSAEGEALLPALARLAYAMQTQRVAAGGKAGGGDGNVLTVVPASLVSRVLSERLLYLAGSASILSVGDEVRFTHQLLQEYFAARHMQAEAEAGRLKAVDLWKPSRWWERAGWEEATVLLAGLHSDDCTPVLEWAADANPEVAAQCIARSGARTPDATKRQLRDLWLPRLTDLKGDPDPRARAAVGRALGQVTLDGMPLDNRTGVSVALGASGALIPDIDWVDIPGGEFVYGDEERARKLRLPGFRMSRYPITYAQFQAFIDDSEGFRNPLWWKGLSASEEHKREPGDQAFKHWNHPCERVSWYDAVAFCRWLSARLGYEVRLPTEREWERAARGRKGREYPYAGEFDPAKANTSEAGIGQTSAVGIFPNGATEEGVVDMAGNVWQWCLNEHKDAAKIQLEGSNTRVARGGSWNFNQYKARAVARRRVNPDSRYNYFGFRVVVATIPIAPL